MNKLVQKLAEMANVTDVEAFATALASETDTDYELNLDGLTVLTAEQKETLTENIKKSVKDKAFNDAFEIQIKNMKKETGLEFEGKDSKDFIANFKAKVLEEANIEPNKKISELETSLETLRGQLEGKDEEIAGIKSSYSLKETRMSAESMIPDLPESLGINKKEAVDLFFLSHEIKEDGIYKNGVKVKGNLEKDATLAETVDSFVTEKGWNKTPSGRGGGAGGSGAGSGNGLSTITSLEGFESYAKENNLNVGSSEYNSALKEVVKANPDIV